MDPVEDEQVAGAWLKNQTGIPEQVIYQSRACKACDPRRREQWAPALANDDVVALCDAEAGRHVGRDVAMPLLIPAGFRVLGFRS